MMMFMSTSYILRSLLSGCQPVQPIAPAVPHKNPGEDLLFADVATLVVNKERSLQHTMTCFADAASSLGLRLALRSWQKKLKSVQSQLTELYHLIGC